MFYDFMNIHTLITRVAIKKILWKLFIQKYYRIFFQKKIVKVLQYTKGQSLLLSLNLEKILASLRSKVPNLNITGLSYQFTYKLQVQHL